MVSQHSTYMNWVHEDPQVRRWFCFYIKYLHNLWIYQNLLIPLIMKYIFCYSKLFELSQTFYSTWRKTYFPQEHTECHAQRSLLGPYFITPYLQLKIQIFIFSTMEKPIIFKMQILIRLCLFPLWIKKSLFLISSKNYLQMYFTRVPFIIIIIINGNVVIGVYSKYSPVSILDFSVVNLERPYLWNYQKFVQIVQIPLQEWEFLPIAKHLSL